MTSKTSPKLFDCSETRFALQVPTYFEVTCFNINSSSSPDAKVRKQQKESVLSIYYKQQHMKVIFTGFLLASNKVTLLEHSFVCSKLPLED